jgi:hypothetical protein
MAAASSSSGVSSGAVRALALELKSLQTSPVEGFTVTVNDDNLFAWTVAIFGPPGTLYQVEIDPCFYHKNRLSREGISMWIACFRAGISKRRSSSPPITPIRRRPCVSSPKCGIRMSTRYPHFFSFHFDCL